MSRFRFKDVCIYEVAQLQSSKEGCRSISHDARWPKAVVAYTLRIFWCCRCLVQCFGRRWARKWSSSLVRLIARRTQRNYSKPVLSGPHPAQPAQPAHHPTDDAVAMTGMCARTTMSWAGATMAPDTTNRHDECTGAADRSAQTAMPMDMGAHMWTCPHTQSSDAAREGGTAKTPPGGHRGRSPSASAVSEAA